MAIIQFKFRIAVYFLVKFCVDFINFFLQSIDQVKLQEGDWSGPIFFRKIPTTFTLCKLIFFSSS